MRKLTKQVLELADEITVVLVANRQRALTGDAQDRATEYFTEYETDQLLTAFRDGGFNTLYFEGEEEFIASTLQKTGKISETPFTLVYNTAQSGTDPGRKSMIPSFCALQNIPTCNSNSYAVSLARHKLHVHAILRRYGIPSPDTWAFAAETGWLRQQKPPLDMLLIAKAGYESASIGLDDHSMGKLSPEYEEVLRRKSANLGQHFVVQKFIEGREFEVPVIAQRRRTSAIFPVEILLDKRPLVHRILSYDIVAHDNFEFYIHADERDPVYAKMRTAAEAVCEVLGLSGFARVDFRVDSDEMPWVTDVATSPHIVQHSSYFHAFKHADWTHSEMLACMVALTAQKAGWIV